jgi:long-chain acyl-CoA synthetase
VESSSLPERPGLDVGVGRTVARLGRQVEVALAGVDLTIAQYRALTQLSEGAEASSSLAAKLAVSRPSATAVVEGLVERGLVERQHFAEDRRRVSVYLTDAGWRVLGLADEAVGAKLADVLTVVSSRRAARALSGIAEWGRAMDANKARKKAVAETSRPAGTA